ncbi:MAG: ABC-type transport auxiliary lipoprotein family protein [Planctomycetota bacterium]|jgi:ABC-type uncharacterized transport system auxiliary subunit|nr:ABC-type transport auxiliary lipoprotein family protein [Planctomycetota bacterium]MDP6763850.1 ABC-type transport auxiliary lipoprotein family protein [Planctomycetota bacterium]MDP6987916.1 ABC-type transport auxiliary lipoprotein family protein [Planctomycetota bacterium]
MRHALAALVLPIVTGACLSAGGPASIRYYSAAPPAGERESPPGETRELRLRDAEAAGHLRDRMAVRTSPVTVEFLDLDRWTEPPIGFVERALARALFETGDFARSESHTAPSLDVELLAFERVPGVTAGLAGVRLVLVLRATDPNGHSLLDYTIEQRIEHADGSPDATARHLSLCLERAAREATRVLAGALP